MPCHGLICCPPDVPDGVRYVVCTSSYPSDAQTRWGGFIYKTLGFRYRCSATPHSSSFPFSPINQSFLGNDVDMLLLLKDHTYSAGLTDPDLVLSNPPRAAHPDSQMKPERKPHKSLSSEKRSQPANPPGGKKKNLPVLPPPPPTALSKPQAPLTHSLTQRRWCLNLQKQETFGPFAIHAIIVS